MLNGTDPIILIQFYEAPPEVKSALSKIPILSAYQDRIGLPPIPIYLSENLTGLYIVSEDKNVDIQTKTETLSDGKTPFVSQQGVGSTVRINLQASQDSIGVTLLSALADQIFQRVELKAVHDHLPTWCDHCIQWVASLVFDQPEPRQYLV
jgi:hypothetical protein